ncbi:MAG TPA: aldolase/citrate lyase family protein [Pirellulales bacterium]|jgi:2-keto-3-deoxy-L-rhamnonate aldolase RhmA/quercetin dioxygenase-like cupin family protein|nr:aldolase/citrate lyase family protein [Pirellulales bacterium]
MKPAAIRTLRNKLAADRPVYGLWITLESPTITEMAVALGIDWILIDAEHGHLDWKEICEHVRSAVRSDTVVLVRVAELNVALIKRALDIGADGVVIPWMESAAQLRQALAFAQFPPEGLRGIGGERATAWGQCFAEHAQEANDHVLVIPMIESVTAGRNLKSILEVAGVDLFLIGPADYSSTAGFRGQWEGPGVAEQLLAIKDAIRAAGKHCGLITTSHENLLERRRQGFRILALGTDTGLLLRGLHGALATVDRDQPIRASLVPHSAAPAPVPLAKPPESLRPDRSENITAVGQGSIAELAPGVRFECLVGKFNSAHRLTTGIVTMAPGSKLDYHTHTCSESVTVLSGSVAMDTEGRRYLLRPLDNIAIPRGLAHQAVNASQSQPAVLHVALATDSPDRQLVEDAFPRRAMPDDCRGTPGAEHVTRPAAARHCEAGPGADLVDFFNHDLLPGIEMSGGYGLFQPGGRLPAHVHDFDESICIVDGQATCLVEGRRYTLSQCATAMVPRGRVHYFVNETTQPMAMVWVYAGPQPERIVVAETCCTTEGNPWK